MSGAAKEVVLGSGVDVAGVLEIDGAGVPVAFRARCHNRRCCPRREGMVPVHRWPIDAATLSRVERGSHRAFDRRYEPRKSVAEMVTGDRRG